MANTRLDYIKTIIEGYDFHEGKIDDRFSNQKAGPEHVSFWIQRHPQGSSTSTIDHIIINVYVVDPLPVKEMPVRLWNEQRDIILDNARLMQSRNNPNTWWVQFVYLEQNAVHMDVLLPEEPTNEDVIDKTEEAN